MKYIVFAKTVNDLTHLEPVLFSEHLVHSEVAKDMMANSLKGYEVDSAGFLSCIDMKCYGKSTSLEVASDPERDTRLIAMLDYNAGVA